MKNNTFIEVIRDIMMSALIIYIIWAIASICIGFSSANAAGAVKIFDEDGRPRGLQIWSTNFLGVIPSDQFTRSLDLRFAQISNTDMTLAESPTIGEYTATLSAGHSIVVNDLISFVDLVGDNHHFMAAKVLSIDTNVVTLDTQIPYSFGAGSDTFVYERTSNMNVDGSSTPQVFGVTNPYTDAADVTKITIHITDNVVSMDDGMFGGLDALTRGIAFRRKRIVDGNIFYENYWNAKTNGEIGLISSGKELDPAAPSGIVGLTATIVYAGMENHGVSIRLYQNESLEMVVQDDLTDLVTFTISAQGHFTTEE